MQRGNLDDLRALVAVARERSFTKAAAKLGVSQSALSQTIRLLEVGLGVRLLTRTTRSVSPTEAGERLLRTVEPRFEEIDAELATIADLREKPAGTIRITATEYAIQSVLVPKLSKLLREYPDIKIEMVVDFGLTDIVAERYDAGVRSGEQVEKDMIAVRIGPNLRMAVAGAPSYFKNRSEPKKPQDLLGHNCINLRLPRHDNIYAWEFDKNGREVRVRVEGQLTFNATSQQINAALAGFGLVYAPEGMLQPYIARGRLRRVLEDWCQPYSGYHLFYPSRRQSSAPAVTWPPSLQAGHKRCSMVKLSVLALNGRLSRRSACVCYQGHCERHTVCPGFVPSLSNPRTTNSLQRLRAL